MPTPRSTIEMEFFAGMRPCEACGDWRTVEWKIGGTGADWTVHAACPRCANERAYAFRSEVDLVEVDVPDLELGGADPSDILDPFELVREIDRVAPLIASAPEQLEAEPWEANHIAVDRIRTALGELAKFLAGDEIPATAFRSTVAHADLLMRPERYQRAWIASEREHWDAVAKRIALDAPRILRGAKPPRGSLDADAIAQHRMWLESNGARGQRLVVVTADAAERVAREAELTGCRLERIRMIGVDLVGAGLARAELVDVDLTRARIETANISDAHLTSCNLTEAIAEHTSFSGVRAEACDFSRGKLATSQWTRAYVERCIFTAADLADTQIGLAHFVACDFRAATLAGAVLAGAIFERCDLRGVSFSGSDLRGTSFVECAFATAYGEPVSTSGWLVTNADLSDRADASDLGDADELYAELVSS